MSSAFCRLLSLLLPMTNDSLEESCLSANPQSINGSGAILQAAGGTLSIQTLGDIGQVEIAQLGILLCLQ